MGEEIEIKCIGSGWAKLEDLNIIQGELKELSFANFISRPF